VDEVVTEATYIHSVSWKRICSETTAMATGLYSTYITTLGNIQCSPWLGLRTYVCTCTYAHVLVVGCVLGYVRTSVCFSAVRWKTLDVLEEPNTLTFWTRTLLMWVTCMSLCIRTYVHTNCLCMNVCTYLSVYVIIHWWTCTQGQWLHYFSLLCVSLYHIPCLVRVQFESAWTQQTPVSLKYQNLGGGRKPAFERPSRKKRKVE